MDRGDRRLQLVRARGVKRGGAAQGVEAGRDGVSIPRGPILLLQEQQAPIQPDPRCASGMLQQQQRLQPEHLRLCRQQVRQQRGELDGLVGQIGPGGRRVSLVEDQVEHGEHRVEAVGQFVCVRRADGNARVAHLALGPHQPLRHRGLGDDERAGDLGRLEPADQTQRQGNLRVQRQGRVATREDQRQALVRDHHLVNLVVVGHNGVESRTLLQHAGLHARAAQQVQGAVAGDRDDPAGGVLWGPIAGPACEGGRERVLNRVLGEVQVPGCPGDDRNRPGPFLTEDLVEPSGPLRRQGSKTRTGRSSIVPYPTPGHFFAQTIASSNESTLSR